MSTNDLPEPFVSAYMIRKINVTVRDGKVRPEWTSHRPEIVNTVDIVKRLHEPGVFLIGWQETHYESRRTQVAGQVYLRDAEVLVNKDHSLNLSILQMMIDDYQQAAAEPGIVKLPEYPSFEQMLFAAGWEFDWAPVGHGEHLGYVAEREVVAKAYEHPIMQKLIKQAGIVDINPTGHNDNLTEPLPEIKAPSQIEDRVNRLELNVDKILEILTGGQNQVPDSSGSAERCPVANQ